MLRRGITLIEVLVVVALIAFLIGMIIPAIQRVRESANRLACSFNLRQIAIALHHFHTDYGHLPPIRENKNIQSKDPVNVLTWMVYLLPYLEDADLFAKSEQAAFRESRPWLNPPHIGLSRVIKTYLCPTDSRLVVPLIDSDGITAGYTSFIGVAGGYTPNGGVLGLYDGKYVKCNRSHPGEQ